MRAPAPRCEPPRAAARRSSRTRDPARRRGGRRRRRRRARDRAHARHGDRDRRSSPRPAAARSSRRHRRRRTTRLEQWPDRHERLDERPRLDPEGRRPRRRRRPCRTGAPEGTCDGSACSIRRATRASIRGTGWSSPASTRASPRPRAACARRRRCRRAPARSASPPDARHPFRCPNRQFRGPSL